jgi:hypothetical protein
METLHKIDLKKRLKRDNKKFIIKIANYEQGVLIETTYKSIEEALHKIELDLMTNLHFGFQNPIQILIKEVGLI